MISALHWIPRGGAKRVPDRYDLTDEELRLVRLKAEGDGEGEAADAGAGAAADLEAAGGAGMAGAGAGDSDSEDGTAEAAVASAVMPLGGDTAEGTGVYYDPSTDPYVTADAHDESDGSDAEDYTARVSDAFVVTANTEEEFSSLEVLVYSEDDANVFVHHDITLPAFPLALAWMDCAPVSVAEGAQGPIGSFMAVGTFQPGIEIWNLDVMDVLEPTAVLGGEVRVEEEEEGLGGAGGADLGTSRGKKGKKSKKKGRRGAGSGASGPVLRAGSHTDAVMGLSWNREHRHLLASGSADCTVKLWDVNSHANIHTFTHHAGKVQSVEWNPAEATVMASGAFDHVVAVFDARSPDAMQSMAVSADIECLHWNPHNPPQLLASCEDGMVACFDVRAPEKPVWTLRAHDKACSSLSVNPLVPGMLATASTDNSVRVWDILGDKPAQVASKALAIGQVFCCSFYGSQPWVLAAGGSKGKLAVWETDEAEAVARRFGSRVLDEPATPWASARDRGDGAGAGAIVEDGLEDDTGTGGGGGAAADVGDADGPDEAAADAGMDLDSGAASGGGGAPAASAAASAAAASGHSEASGSSGGAKTGRRKQKKKGGRG